MMSFSAMSAYFWAIYIWFCAGVGIVGVLGLRDIFKTLKKK